MKSNLITNSRMGAFKTCRKRHWWEYEIGLRPIVDAKALRMGSAYHLGLDHLKLGHGVQAAIEGVRAFYHQIHVDSAESQERLDFERETVVCMVHGYDWRWANSWLDVIETEKSFRLPLINPSTGSSSRLFELAGKIDGIVRLEDGRLAVLEHKLQSDSINLDGDYWPRLQLDSQCTLYVYAARQMGFDVATVLWDVARKPTIRPSQVALTDENGFKIVLDQAGQRVMTKDGKKPRETPDTKSGWTLQTRPMNLAEWIDKLHGDITSYPETYYARNEIPRLDQDIEELCEEIWDIQNVLREAQRSQRWYKTVHRDTCSYCAYFGLCTSRFNPEVEAIPEGFELLENVHPELEEK